MNGRTGSRKDSRKKKTNTNTTKSYKGQEVVESYYHPRPERTGHIKF